MAAVAVAVASPYRLLFCFALVAMAVSVCLVFLFWLFVGIGSWTGLPPRRVAGDSHLGSGNVAVIIAPSVTETRRN